MPNNCKSCLTRSKMKISSLAKFLDQPLLNNYISRTMPTLLCTSACIFGIKDTLSKPQNERVKFAKKNFVVLGIITATTLMSISLVKINGKKLIDILPKEQILKAQREAISKFINSNTNIDHSTRNILNKAKSEILTPIEIDHLISTIKDKKSATVLINTLFGNNENLTSGKIWDEVSRLSLLGFIPVFSGILAGIISDKINNEYSKEKTCNKIKEGIYQFLANIFLCNIGAGSFLYIAEKLHDAGILNSLTPVKKMFIILSGILTVGVFGGSYIANSIGKHLVNPLIGKFANNNLTNQKNDTRNPELLDIALHSDDIATAGLLSGVKWIEPLLPIMYLISGYRAAIGYRNNNKNFYLDKDTFQKHN